VTGTGKCGLLPLSPGQEPRDNWKRYTGLCSTQTNNSSQERRKEEVVNGGEREENVISTKKIGLWTQ
jgi:hypothetical protein